MRTVNSSCTRARTAARLMPIAGVLFSLTACVGDAPTVKNKNDGGASGGRTGAGGSGGGGGPGTGGAPGGGGSIEPGSGGAGNVAGSGGAASGGSGGNVVGSGGSGSGGLGGAVMPGSGGQTMADGGLAVDAGMEAPGPAKLSVDRAQVPFGAVTIGASSTAAVMVVKNIGGTASGALTIALGGAGAPMFSAVTNACGGMVLVPGASCSVTVTFAPKTPGMVTATLTVNGGAAVSVASTLDGTGEFATIVASLDGALLTVLCNGATLTGYTCINVGCGATGGVATAKAFSSRRDREHHLRCDLPGARDRRGLSLSGRNARSGNGGAGQQSRLLPSGGATATGGPGRGDLQQLSAGGVPHGSGGSYPIYFLNSIPINPADPSVQRLTFPVDYTKTIRVRGGGTIHLSNQRQRLPHDHELRTDRGHHVHGTAHHEPRRCITDPPASFVQPLKIRTTPMVSGCSST